MTLRFSYFASNRFLKALWASEVSANNPRTAIANRKRIGVLTFRLMLYVPLNKCLLLLIGKYCPFSPADNRKLPNRPEFLRNGERFCAMATPSGALARYLGRIDWCLAGSSPVASEFVKFNQY